MFATLESFKPKNPISLSQSFVEYRDANMEIISESLWKKCLRSGKQSLDSGEFEVMRIVYSSEVYTEGVKEPMMIETHAVLSVAEKLEPVMGITDALKTMTVGEESLFWIEKQRMFRKDDNIVKIQLISAEKCELKPVKSAFDSTIEKALKLKKEAEELMTKADCHEGLRILKQMTRILDENRTNSKDEEQQNKQLLVSSYLSSADCFLKLQKFNKVCIMIKCLQDHINIEQNSKALYYKGMASLGFKRYQEAKRLLQKASWLDRNNETILDALKQVEMKEKQARDDEIAEHNARIEIAKEQNRLAEIQKIKAIEKEERLEKRRIEKELKFQALKAKTEAFLDAKMNSELKYHEVDFKLREAGEVSYVSKLCKETGFKLRNMEMDSEIVFYLEKLDIERGYQSEE